MKSHILPAEMSITIMNFDVKKFIFSRIAFRTATFLLRAKLVEKEAAQDNVSYQKQAADLYNKKAFWNENFFLKYQKYHQLLRMLKQQLIQQFTFVPFATNISYFKATFMLSRIQNPAFIQ